MLIYLHGFNSSPLSHKAQVLRQYLSARGLERCYSCPALSHEPRQAIDAVEAEISRHEKPLTFIGSSLGGFYATYLAEKHDTRAILINPAIHPHVDLRAYLGEQQNLHSGERYELTERHLDQWAELYVADIKSERYLLIVETGDEVLDYHAAMQRYAGARQFVIEGGDHSLQSFPRYLDLIARFAGLKQC